MAAAAAPTVKRVTQELGGKSAHIILEDADLASAVKEGAQSCFRNTGQSCNAPTRMLVPRSRMAEAAATAKQTAAATKVGDPFTDGTNVGPLASKAQFEKVQRLIEQGIAEGAKLVAGGPGRPEGLQRLFREADGVCGCSQRHDYRSRRDFRACALRDPLQR